MGMVRSVLFWLSIVAWLPVSCNDAPPEQNPGARAPLAAEKRDAAPPPTPEQEQFVYVKALSGLRLRKAPDPASEQLTTIPFGTKIQKLDSVSVNPFTVEGRQGRMIEVAYENRRGYVFEGFTTAGTRQKRLWDGKYCFKSSNVAGYEYLEFTIDADGIINGKSDGHGASEAVTWTSTFTGIFEETGNILVKTTVHNESGIQPPRLETWEIADTTFLIVKRPSGQAVRFKKTGCGY